MFKIFMESMASILIKCEFKHVWFTDQLTSLIGPMRDMEYTLCYYVHYNSKLNNKIDTFEEKKVFCGTNRVLVLLIGVLPHFLRSLQVINNVYK